MSAPVVAYGGPKAVREKTDVARAQESTPSGEPFYRDRDSDLPVVALVISLLLAGMFVAWRIWRRRTLGFKPYELPPRPRHGVSPQSDHARASRSPQGSRTAPVPGEGARGGSRAPDGPGRSAAPARLGPPGAIDSDPATDHRRNAPSSLDGSGTSIRLSTPRRTEQLSAPRSVNDDDSDRHPAAHTRTNDAAPQRLDPERTDPSAERLSLEQRVNEYRQLVHELAELHRRDLDHLHQRLAQMEARLAEGLRPPTTERATSVAEAARGPSPDEAAPPAPHTLEGRLLQIWNDFNWEQGKPSLSVIERVLRDESYDLVENIVGTYALAVPVRSGDDPHTPVYVLPFLGKANALYDDSLFERPQTGDSSRVRAAAKVRFAERGVARASLERLKAGNEKLSQVFTVLQPGRIE
jgi:hypothetical protein